VWHYLAFAGRMILGPRPLDSSMAVRALPVGHEWPVTALIFLHEVFHLLVGRLRGNPDY
jgi:hypothetical protein